VFFERTQHLVRIDVKVSQNVLEGGPFHLCEGDTHVFAGEQRVIATPGFFDGSREDAIGRLAEPFLRDVELFDHGASVVESSKTGARAARLSRPAAPELGEGGR
jgi:hypothetical protein